MKRFLPVFLLVFAVSAAALPSYVTFAVQGAAGTYPTSINSSGSVAGTYSTGVSGVAIGFVRTADGTITTFNPPNSMYVLSTVIIDSGAVYGSFQDTSGYYHGYVRTADGSTIKVYDIGNPQSFTNVLAANNNGLVAGTFFDGNEEAGFIYYPLQNSAYYPFTIPNSNGIVCWSINDLGVVAGDYVDTNNVYHGFSWYEGPSLQTFDVPNQTTPGTYATGINNGGVIAGYAGSGLYPPNAFVRSANGTITTFAPLISERIYARGINTSGQIVAYYANSAASTNFHGVIRQTNGLLTTFDVPLSPSTTAFGINDAGQVTGHYTVRSSGVINGYIRTP